MTARHESGRTRTGILLVVLVIVAAAVAAAGALAVRRWAPVPAGTSAKLRDAIVGFELAKEPVRPTGLVGKTLTAADRAALQATHQRLIRRYAGGPELREWIDWDYSRALLGNEWGTRELTGITGKIVYWDFLHRDADGAIVVRAGVEKRFGVTKWDAAADRAVPQPDWVPSVSVNQYTLKQVNGTWKIIGDGGVWRFYDPVTHELGTGP